MAGGREIKTKIKSVQNTRKVTRALEMVSASKIRKAQERMKASRPYARAMKQVIGHIAQANSEFQHPYLVERKQIKRVGYVIVSSDRGLARSEEHPSELQSLMTNTYAVFCLKKQKKTRKNTT